MALSLQEQLLKAGLADKEKAKQVRQQKQQQARAQKNHNIVQTDQAKIDAEQKIQLKKENDLILNQQAKQQADKKAEVAQIRQLIEMNKQSKGKGDVPCSFTDGIVIKRIYVSQRVQKHISQGQLAIVKLEQGYELVPSPVADKIAQRDPSVVVYRADNVVQEQQSSSENDEWYADYVIPDDLNW
jgi:uncharacterized protein YaiL (DUF2058 family)